jgi:diguanylate cyclase (GGDEF)-like protein
MPELRGLDDLRTYFAARLPVRFGEIEDAWNDAVAGGWDAAALGRFHRLVHALAGTGTTFGYPDVSYAARELEREIEPLALPGDAGEEGESAAIGGRPDERRTAHLEALLAGLRQACERPAPAAQPQPAPDEPPRADRLLFLIENDVEHGEHLAAQLGHYDYRVRLFQDRASLEAALERERPSAVVVDLDSGGALTAAERTALASGDPPVRLVFLSWRGDLESRLEAVRAGGSAYLTRPIDVAHLVEVLDMLTDRREAGYRVLVVDDDPDLAELHAGILRRAGMEVRIVLDPLQVSEPLVTFHPDLILLDVYMPGCTGPQLAAVLRQQESWVSTPIVFLSTEGGLPEQIEAIDLGGDEFLTKPIEPRLLVAAVKARARRGRILSSLIAQDGLTGLLNHSSLKLQLENEIARASREGSAVAYAMLDLDRFKAINDAHGHGAGDRLLRNLAMFLKQRLRRSDVIGRYGGDEIAVILPHTDGKTACRVLDEIRENFSHLRHLTGEREILATLSCGIGSYPEAPNVARLIAAADAALYDAKRAGRNRTVLARP